MFFWFLIEPANKEYAFVYNVGTLYVFLAEKSKNFQEKILGYSLRQIQIF